MFQRAVHLTVARAYIRSRGCVHMSRVAATLSHVPFQFFELSSHFCFGLAQIASRSREYPALQAHLSASTAWLVWCFVLLNITANLKN